MRGVILSDSLLGSDVAPISIRHKDNLKHNKILRYFCQYGHGYATLPLQDGNSTFIIEKTNRMGLKLHLYLTEKDEMEKKDPEVKAQKTSNID
jgi:hypothetical protein